MLSSPNLNMVGVWLIWKFTISDLWKFIDLEKLFAWYESAHLWSQAQICIEERSFSGSSFVDFFVGFLSILFLWSWKLCFVVYGNRDNLDLNDVCLYL